MKITSCEFEAAAYSPRDEPRSDGPCVALLGRSNVGKSALINRLLGAKGLARTSSQPGRTQSINYYRVNGSWYMIDLPGYGYAKVPEAVRRSWGPLVEGFLEFLQERIVLALLVVDARREPTDLDRLMRDWVEERDMRYVVVATKSDKLSGNGRAKAERALARGFGGSDRIDPILASSTTGRGIPRIWSHLDQVLSGGRK